jgi:hypothetical protein
MGAWMNDDELIRRKRHARLRIGRSRRRIDRRLRTTRETARQLTSWRSYVARYPAWALTTVLGLGFAAATGGKPRRLSSRMGLLLVRRILATFRRQLWTEVRKVWSQSPR